MKFHKKRKTVGDEPQYIKTTKYHIDRRQLEKSLEKRLYLLVLSGERERERLAITGSTVTLGRGKYNDIIFQDDQISRLHCSLYIKGDNVTIEDHNSTNGTIVEHQKIKGQQLLKLDDLVKIGSVLFKVTAKDVMDLEYEDTLLRAATLDNLTNIPNRRWLVKMYEEVKSSELAVSGFSIVMFDIDKFKLVNDTHGHAAGDYVLKQIAGFLSSMKRTKDLLARYGGEEFLLILRNEGSFKNNEKICERIRKEVESFVFEFDNKTIPVTLSGGVFHIKAGTIGSLEDYIAKADKALYTAKDKGRNRIEVSP